MFCLEEYTAPGPNGILVGETSQTQGNCDEENNYQKWILHSRDSIGTWYQIENVGSGDCLTAECSTYFEPKGTKYDKSDNNQLWGILWWTYRQLLIVS